MKNPNVTISQSAFHVLKPFFVRTLKERNVCCCKYHVELIMLKDALNRMRQSQQLHGADCGCECNVCHTMDEGGDETSCSAGELTYRTLTGFWQSCICPKEEGEEWHRRSCLMGECSACGVDKLLEICPEEENGNHIVKWKRFEKTVIGGYDATGVVKKRIQEVFKETTSVEFLQYLKPNLQKFIKHNYVACWQDSQCHLAMETIPEGVLISHVDFSENYTFAVQDEIQSMYYHSYQVTIMVHITYRRNPDFVEDGDFPKLIKAAHFWISDDREHDTLFVQFCFIQHWEWLQSQGVTPREHWVFSDGCSSQFKACRPMYFVSRYPGLTGGCQMKWSYFGTGHGKGNLLHVHVYDFCLHSRTVLDA